MNDTTNPVAHHVNGGSLAAHLRKQGTALLEQQMWCLGCDVRCERGNLLLAYGFMRRPAPVPRLASAYTLTTDAGSMTAWGFALLYAHEPWGTVLLRRGRFEPLYSQTAYLLPEVWRAVDLPPLCRPNDKNAQHAQVHLLRMLVSKLAAYERWIATQMPPAYRHGAWTAWPHRRKYKGVSAADLPSAWLELCEQYDQLIQERMI